MERQQFGQKGEEQLDTDGMSDHWSLACTHDDDDQLMASGARTHTRQSTRSRGPEGFVTGRIRVGVSARLSPGLHEGPCLDRRV